MSPPPEKFKHYNKAKEFARNNPGSSLKRNPITRKGWIVQPKGATIKPNYTHTEFTEEENEPDDQKEMREEKSDYADSMSRSNEEGWFYDKTDGDWDNNLVDPDTEHPF